MAHGAAEYFRLDEIRGVAVNVEANDNVRLRGRVVREHFCLLDGVSGWRSLIDAYFVDRDKHRGVGGARNVEEGSGDNFHACDAVFIKFWCGCGV